MSKKIVLASNNKKKMKELQELLSPLGFEILAQGTLGIPPAEEPYETFLENALAKARHASKESGLPAIADDSGICADALGGAPGVFSARFAGEPSDDAANNAKLVCELKGKTNRKAHYVCVLVAVKSAHDPEPLVAIDNWDGVVADEPRGNGGFGYDPFFVVDEKGTRAAELSSDEKNRVSHRGKAMRKMKTLIEQRWGTED